MRSLGVGRLGRVLRAFSAASSPSSRKVSLSIAAEREPQGAFVAEPFERDADTLDRRVTFL
jgi:hypothetical protein